MTHFATLNQLNAVHPDRCSPRTAVIGPRNKLEANLDFPLPVFAISIAIWIEPWNVGLCAGTCDSCNLTGPQISPPWTYILPKVRVCRFFLPIYVPSSVLSGCRSISLNAKSFTGKGCPLQESSKQGEMFCLADIVADHRTVFGSMVCLGETISGDIRRSLRTGAGSGAWNGWSNNMGQSCQILMTSSTPPDYARDPSDVYLPGSSFSLYAVTPPPLLQGDRSSSQQAHFAASKDSRSVGSTRSSRSSPTTIILTNHPILKTVRRYSGTRYSSMNSPLRLPNRS